MDIDWCGSHDDSSWSYDNRSGSHVGYMRPWSPAHDGAAPWPYVDSTAAGIGGFGRKSSSGREQQQGQPGFANQHVRCPLRCPV